LELPEQGILAIYYLRGISYYELKKYQNAINGFNKVIESNLELSDWELDEIYNYRGNSYYEIEEYQKAIDDYTEAIELDQYLANAFYYRGLAYSQLKDFPTAACGNLYQAGMLFLKQNNIDQALLCVDEMKKAEPSSPFINRLMDEIF
jgi:tetratricopeptide (TPR) repeat protein